MNDLDICAGELVRAVKVLIEAFEKKHEVEVRDVDVKHLEPSIIAGGKISPGGIQVDVTIVVPVIHDRPLRGQS